MKKDDMVAILDSNLRDYDGILAYMQNIKFQMEEGDLNIALSCCRNEYNTLEPAFKKIEEALKTEKWETVDSLIFRTMEELEKMEAQDRRDLQRHRLNPKSF